MLNLWQKNQVFTADIIQPIFDLADPNKRPEPTANGGTVKASPQKALDGTPKWPETAGSTPKVMNTPGGDQQQSLVQQLQTLQQIFILQQQQQGQSDAQQVYFSHFNLINTKSNKYVCTCRLNLTRNYWIMIMEMRRKTTTTMVAQIRVHREMTLCPLWNHLESELQALPMCYRNSFLLNYSLLANPVVLRQLQTLQMSVSHQQQVEMEDKVRRLHEMKQQEAEFDKHLAQTVPVI